MVEKEKPQLFLIDSTTSSNNISSPKLNQSDAHNLNLDYRGKTLLNNSYTSVWAGRTNLL